MTTEMAAVLEAGVNSMAPTRPLAVAELSRGRILVFEDEAVIALDLQRILRGAGFRIVGPATSLGEAEALIARGRIDCAVLDLDAARDRAPAVADLLADAGIPFVLLSTSREEVPARHAARKLVEKPYAAGELLDAVMSAISEGIAASGDGIVYPMSAQTLSFPRLFPQL
jgi:CheY-like chemotaxis protein